MTTRLDEIRATLKETCERTGRPTMTVVTVPAPDLAYLLDRVEKLERLRVAAEACAAGWRWEGSMCLVTPPCRHCVACAFADALDAAQPDATPDEKGEP